MSGCNITPKGYLDLIRKFVLDDGDRSIDATESTELFETAEKCPDATIKHIYRQLSDGYFVSAYKDGLRGGDDNFCLNFSSEAKRLPCGLNASGLTGGVFGRSGIEDVVVEPHKFFWKDNNLHVGFAAKAKAWFGTENGHMPIDDGVQMVQDNIGIISLVEEIIPKMYRDCWLPEATCLLTYTLLNTFLVSEEINSDVKYHYLKVVEKAAREYAGRFDSRKAAYFDAIGSTPAKIEERDGILYEIYEMADQDRMLAFTDKLKQERSAMQNIWSGYAAFLEKNFSAKAFEAAKPLLAGLGRSIDSIISMDIETVRYRLKDQRYGETVTDYLSQISADYLERAKGFNDHFLDGLGFETAIYSAVAYSLVSKWVAKNVVSRLGRFGMMAGWAMVGMLAYSELRALTKVYGGVELLPLRMPDLTGLRNINY